jgi:DNA repair exonuclease SbcCD ATPase subunit
MASQYDATEFVDTETHQHKSPYATATTLAGAMHRAPTREEVDIKVTEAQQKLAELKRAQEELERERAALEEVRRRQAEFQTGRQEMVHQLTRGLGLLEEAEFTARRDAEQMAKTLGDFREALSKVETIREETWNKDNFNVELTRALTTIENARMEWNSARMKFPVLTGKAAEPIPENEARPQPLAGIPQQDFAGLCRLGLALTWPLALVALLAFGALAAVLWWR